MTQRAFRDTPNVCRISVANDGEEALNFLHKVKKFSEAPTPNLILLDLNMPKIDGKKFLKIVKNEAKFKVIPIVMLTSSQSASDIRDCYELHASCYVVKPFDAKEFENTIRQIINFWGNVGRLP